jgi:hypothetical protein
MAQTKCPQPQNPRAAEAPAYTHTHAPISFSRESVAILLPIRALGAQAAADAYFQRLLEVLRGGIPLAAPDNHSGGYPVQLPVQSWRDT